MKKNNRYVLDTNVIVSALLFEKSKPGKVFQKALTEGEILLSLPVLKELNDVLNRKKFNRYLYSDEKDLFFDVFIREATLIEIIESINVCSDPKDNKFLELAVSGEATCIISGDNHLLELSPFRGIEILKPDDFITSY